MGGVSDEDVEMDMAMDLDFDAKERECLESEVRRLRFELRMARQTNAMVRESVSAREGNEDGDSLSPMSGVAAVAEAASPSLMGEAQTDANADLDEVEHADADADSVIAFDAQEKVIDDNKLHCAPAAN